MDTIDRNWILARLDPEDHGQKARLARALGIEQQKLSKILAGTRRVQPDEVLRVMAFFDEDAAGSGPGFAEPDVAPFETQPAMRLAIEALIPGAGHAAAWLLACDMFGFAMLRGDLVLMDLKATPRDGQLVIATIGPASGNHAQTSIYRKTGNWLLPAAIGDKAVALDDPEMSVGIHGPVIGVLRGTAEE